MNNKEMINTLKIKKMNLLEEYAFFMDKNWLDKARLIRAKLQLIDELLKEVQE